MFLDNKSFATHQCHFILIMKHLQPYILKFKNGILKLSLMKNHHCLNTSCDHCVIGANSLNLVWYLF